MYCSSIVAPPAIPSPGVMAAAKGAPAPATSNGGTPGFPQAESMAEAPVCSVAASAIAETKSPSLSLAPSTSNLSSLKSPAWVGRPTPALLESAAPCHRCRHRRSRTTGRFRHRRRRCHRSQGEGGGQGRQKGHSSHPFYKGSNGGTSKTSFRWRIRHLRKGCRRGRSTSTRFDPSFIVPRLWRQGQLRRRGARPSKRPFLPSIMFYIISNSGTPVGRRSEGR